MGHPKRKRSSSNHPFSGSKMLVSGRVLGFACLMPENSSKNSLPNGGLMVMHPMIYHCLSNGNIQIEPRFTVAPFFVHHSSLGNPNSRLGLPTCHLRSLGFPGKAGDVEKRTPTIPEQSMKCLQGLCTFDGKCQFQGRVYKKKSFHYKLSSRI